MTEINHDLVEDHQFIDEFPFKPPFSSGTFHLVMFDDTGGSLFTIIHGSLVKHYLCNNRPVCFYPVILGDI